MRKLILALIFGILPLMAFAAGTPGRPAPRYISLAPSTTEILFALGLDEEIVGVSSFCDYPQKAKNKPKIGNFSEPNIEQILALKPDYVFSTGLEQDMAVSQLRGLGLKVYVGDPKTIEGLLDSILEIGRLTNRESAALELVKSMQDQIQVIKLKVDGVAKENRPRVFIEVWHDPLTTVGKGSFIDELITTAGGVNIAHDVRRPYSIFSQEEVIKRNPDCIILAYMNKDNPSTFMDKRLGWAGIKAVKNKRVYGDINPDLLLRPGPRVIEGLKELYRKFYP